MGPDRPITLHLADVKFGEIHTKAIVEENLDRQLKVDISVQAEPTARLSCHCALLDGESGKIVKEETLSLEGAKTVSVDWALDSALVKLWWPNGAGEQKRYRFECTLRNEVSQAAREVAWSSLIALAEGSRPGYFYADDRLPTSTTGAGTTTRSTRKDIPL
jgi:hypothetical protein